MHVYEDQGERQHPIKPTHISGALCLFIQNKFSFIIFMPRCGISCECTVYWVCYFWLVLLYLHLHPRPFSALYFILFTFTVIFLIFLLLYTRQREWTLHVHTNKKVRTRTLIPSKMDIDNIWQKVKYILKVSSGVP